MTPGGTTPQQEPYFPTLEDAVEANQAALAGWGQSNHALLRSDVLEGALGRAENYWAYTGSLPQAAAALAHGVGQAQAFEDGNKRTAYWLTHHFLHENDLGHIAPDDDEELADHLIGYGEGTHGMEDTASMFEQRLGGSGRVARTAAGDEWRPGMLGKGMVLEGPSGPMVTKWRVDENGWPGHSDWYDWQRDPIASYDQHLGFDIQPDGRVSTSWGNSDYVPVAAESDPRLYHGARPRLAKRTQSGTVVANILDPIQDQLDPTVWDEAHSPKPRLKPEHVEWICDTLFRALEDAGYDNPDRWLKLVLTGSLTTYQYSPESDCDVSLFVDSTMFPEWSRAEMIGLMISNMDGQYLPGTTHAMQCFVVSSKLKPEDLYKPGLRSGYTLHGRGSGTWIVPPDRSRVHDVEQEMNQAYTIALENADKMERLLRYEPDKAVMFWHQIHKRRMRDQSAGKGDYSPSNITYKFLANRGLFPKISEVSGEHIA